jgi:hypothetical protein
LGATKKTGLCPQNHGINVADLKKLKSAGICTIRGLKMNTKKKLLLTAL